ncbi:MAG: transposase [Clostridia bacterium]|nr:transposase [Clostridia bacterium]
MLAEEIRQLQKSSYGTYGYRRMQMALASKGIYHNPKTVLRVMEKV